MAKILFHNGPQDGLPSAFDVAQMLSFNEPQATFPHPNYPNQSPGHVTMIAGVSVPTGGLPTSTPAPDTSGASSASIGLPRMTVTDGQVAAIDNASVTFVTGAYTVASTDDIISASAIGGSLAITLPAAAGAGSQRFLFVDKSDSTANTVSVVVATGSGDTINGTGSYVLTAQYQIVMFVSDGASAWYAIPYAGNQAANKVYAGPATGSAASPAFRLLVAADIPNIAESQVTGLAADLAARPTGSGTTGTIPVWTAGSTLGNGLLSQASEGFATNDTLLMSGVAYPGIDLFDSSSGAVHAGVRSNYNGQIVDIGPNMALTVGSALNTTLPGVLLRLDSRSGYTGEACSFWVYNAGDPPTTVTKVFAIDTSGNVTARSVALTAGTVTNVPTPSASTDAANKGYVDAAVAGGLGSMIPELQVTNLTTDLAARLQLGGDITGGTASAPVNTGMRGIPWSSTSPANNQVPVYVAAHGDIEWQTPPGGGGPALSGLTWQGTARQPR